MRWEFVSALLACCATLAHAEGSYAPQPESSLGKTLTISWSRGPNLPQGFQDSAGGIVRDWLVTACGFCAGRDNDKKPGRYPRGFMKKVWALNLKDEAAGWKDLPEFPGAARQGSIGVVVGDAIYYWGGFSYSEPYCYTDGWRLEHKNEQWTWAPLPPLPWPISGGMSCHLGAKIYALGGADYDSERFYTAADRHGGHKRLGAQFLAFDTTSIERGWQPLPECPGTPRWVGALAAVEGKIYVIGGATGDPYATVVDNWVYDPAAASWARIRDLPIASGNFPSGQIVFRNRYILLGGGYQYSQIANPDGTTRPPYGTPHRFHDKGDYYSDMFVYDTKSGLFGRADSMPLNNNLSMMLVYRDSVLMLGGETGGAVVEGEFYGHHPDLFLKGAIAVADPRQ